MKIRNILIIIIMSVVISGVISYVTEYNRINEILPNVDNTLRTAVDMSVDQVLMSDDFYLDSMNYGSSSGVASDSSEVTNTKLWVHGNSEDKNMLDAVMKYDKINSDNYRNKKSGLRGSNTSASIKSRGEDFRREAFLWQFETNEFRKFYDWVSSTGKFKASVYNLDNNEYKKEKACTLDLMGASALFGEIRAYSGERNRTGKILTSDDVVRIEKEGYYGNYMLTPTALGITYINKDMLLPLLQTNLEMLCSYSLASNVTEDTRLSDKHIRCMETYSNTHIVKPEEYIINNGYFEIDLNKINIDIEYRAVDMLDLSNKKILDLALGNTGNNHARAVTNESEKFIVIAKVSVDIGIHIPLGSPFMQGYSRNPHLDINNIDSNGNYINEGEGLVYTYTIYKAITP